jgi:hypothetical protein
MLTKFFSFQLLEGRIDFYRGLVYLYDTVTVHTVLVNYYHTTTQYPIYYALLATE